MQKQTTQWLACDLVSWHCFNASFKMHIIPLAPFRLDFGYSNHTSGWAKCQSAKNTMHNAKLLLCHFNGNIYFDVRFVNALYRLHQFASDNKQTTNSCGEDERSCLIPFNIWNATLQHHLMPCVVDSSLKFSLIIQQV